MPTYTIGFVYVLSNEAMPGIVKVGKTTKLAEDRARKLYDTGVPLPFDVEFRSATSHPKAVEDEAHAMLAPLRVNPKREFFRVSPPQAIDAVKDALLNVASITAWRSDKPHRVRHGDRLVLTMRAGDLFVRLHYPHITARIAELVDLRQAHTDGDLLDLMGTHDPGHVAGFSDGDPCGDTDPVPYLDRTQDTPNGSINGRERLVPGERLLWLRPMANGESCTLALFEMVDYCQVISRTWHMKFGPDNLPLLLNTPTCDPPPCVLRATWAAMRLPLPRTWALRNPDPLEGWASVADKPQPPEYWLTQLKPRPRRGGDHQ